MNLKDIAIKSGDEPFHAQQKWTELADLLKFLAPRKPKRILEIGVYKGGTIMAWTHIADDNALIVGVDLPDGEFGGGFDDMEAIDIVGVAKAYQDIKLVTADSQDKETVEFVRGQYDFIFIDGDHRYEGVQKDYENYYPMLTAGGVMAFHDIVRHSNPDVQVRKLWLELQSKHRYYEFIDKNFPTDHGAWGGIGVIMK